MFLSAWVRERVFVVVVVHLGFVMFSFCFCTVLMQIQMAHMSRINSSGYSEMLTCGYDMLLHSDTPTG